MKHTNYVIIHKSITCYKKHLLDLEQSTQMQSKLRLLSKFSSFFFFLFEFFPVRRSIPVLGCQVLSLGLPFLFTLPTPLVVSLLSLSKCNLWQKVLIRSWIFLLLLSFMFRLTLEDVEGLFNSVVAAAASNPVMWNPPRKRCMSFTGTEIWKWQGAA